MIDLYVIYFFVVFIFLLNTFSYLRTYKKFTGWEKSVYIYLFISILGWLVCNITADLNKSPVVTEVFARLAILFPINVINSILVLTRVFPLSPQIVKQTLSFKAIQVGVIGFSIFSLFALNTDLNIQSFKSIPNSTATFQPGPLYTVTVIFAVLILFYIGLYWLKNFKNYTKAQKRQVLYILISLSIVYLSLSFGLVFLPVLGAYQYIPMMFLSLGLLLFVINQNLFMKGFVADVFHDISVVLGSVLSGGLGLVLFIILKVNNYELSFLSVFLIYIVFLSFVFVFYEKIITLSKRSIKSFNNNVLEFANNTTTILEKDEVLTELEDVLKKIFPDAKSYIFTDDELYKNEFSLVLEWWKSYPKAFITTQEIIIEKYFNDTKGKYKTKSLYDFFKTHSVDFIIPLNIDKKLGGIIVIKDLGYVLGLKEYELLSLLARNASVAISRCMLYEEVEAFNKTLQGKVNHQTRELQQKIDQLEEARRKERDMMDIMGHELRTPLSIIKMTTNLISSKVNNSTLKPEEYPTYEKRIKDSLGREIELLERMLSSTKIDAGRMELHFEEVDIVEIIKSAVMAEEPKAEEKGLKLIFEAPEEPVNVYADKVRINEVVDNFVGNAVKYTREGQVEVKLITHPKNHTAEIEVIDTGIGIPKKEIANLGKKFYRIQQYIPSSEHRDETKVVRPGGTGLGLYVSFGLIKLMGGDIKVSSQMGKGSKFSFTIPLYKGQKEKGISQTEAKNLFSRMGFKQKEK